jgi:hypothetical protein
MIRSIILRLPFLLLLAAPLALTGCGNKEDDLLPVIEGVSGGATAPDSVASYEQARAKQQKATYSRASGYPGAKR